MPKLEEGFAMAGLNVGKEFIPDERIATTCGSCGTYQSAARADRRDGEIVTRYLCFSCSTEVFRVTLNANNTVSFGFPFGHEITVG